MGPVNQGMWRAFNVGTAGRFSDIVNFVPHPCNPQRKLWFQPDPGHLLKNLKESLLNNKTIVLPDKFVKLHNLSSPDVSSDHTKHILNCQEDLTFKIAPKLKSSHFEQTTYGKMKVNRAVNFFSHDTSASLYFLSKSQSQTAFSTTACFIDKVSRWFDLMTSRTIKLALGKTHF